VPCGGVELFNFARTFSTTESLVPAILECYQLVYPIDLSAYCRLP